MTKYDVLTVTPARKEGGKDYWTRIGMAFPAKNGGFDIYLNALPLNGKLFLREPKERGGEEVF